MPSANQYSGIDARIVASVRHHARRARGKLPGLDLEDLEQELMLHAHRRLNSYDPTRADLWTYVDRVLVNFLANLAKAARAKSRGSRISKIPLDDPNLEHGSEAIAVAADNGGSAELSCVDPLARAPSDPQRLHGALSRPRLWFTWLRESPGTRKLEADRRLPPPTGRRP